MGRVGARIPSEGVQVELPKYLDAIRALDGVTAGRLLDKLWNNREELQEILETLSADDLNWVMENWGNRNLDEIWYIVAGSEKILGNLSGENLSLALNRLSIHDSVNLILSSSAKLSDRIASALPALPLEQFTRKLCDEVYGRSSADKFVRSLGKGAAIRLALTLGASSLEELITRVDKDSMDHLAEIYQSEIYGSGRFVQPKSINRLCSLLGPKALAALFMANKGGQLLTGLSNNNLQRLFRQFPDYKLEEWLRTFEYFDRLVSGLTKVELNLVAKALSSSDALEARTRFIQSVGRSNLGSINSNWIARFANEITEQGFHLPLS
jgi:Mg/Co/Ni transporter MgtE